MLFFQIHKVLIKSGKEKEKKNLYDGSLSKNVQPDYGCMVH